jgi:surface antigen Omp85-like protein
VYRMDLDSRSPVQLTNLLTGVSGITELSPALSASSSRVAFSVYENDGFNIYTLNSTAPPAQAATTVTLPRDAGFLAPRVAGEGPVFAYLRNEDAGLPQPTTAFPTQPYRPKLSLDYLGQPVVGLGVDSFGTYVGGGISAVFSDMLGNHTVGADVQLTNRFDEAGGSLIYLNRTHRWNWGAAIDQTPYVVRGFTDRLVVTPAGQPLVEEDEFRTVQTDRGFSGIVVYPFSRAQRVEFSSGLRQITGKQDVTARLFDPNTGQQLTQDTTRLATFPTLNLGTTSSALVYDTSIFGVTSPIRGSRYRLEYDQTYDLHGSASSTLSGGRTNTLTYGAALADYRTYLMPVRPFTIALRGMYYGRYGAGAESTLLTPVFIGYPDLVRGYDVGSFDATECGNAANGSCPVFDRLLGSRMIVTNAELRFPLWGALGGSNFYGPLPVELAVFGDAGAAWDRSHSLHLTGADRNLVRSIGAAARINLFGFAVGEIDYVHPLDRPLRGWMWEFNLRPGF